MISNQTLAIPSTNMGFDTGIVSGFQPSLISGLVCWNDFTDLSTVTVSSGLIDSVTDKSGNGNTATASGVGRPTYTASGTGNLPTSTWDGTANFMSYASGAFMNAPLSMFVVIRTPASVAGTRSIICRGDGGSNNGSIVLRTSAPNFQYVHFDAAASYPNVTQSAAGNTNYIISTTGVAVDSASAVSIAVNSNAVTSGGTQASFANNAGLVTRLGDNSAGTAKWLGTISEILVFNRVITNAERTQIRNFLNTKYRVF